jgi:hypothetical protein
MGEYETRSRSEPSQASEPKKRDTSFPLPKLKHAGMSLGTAQVGVANASGKLPHLDTIQHAFGRHDVTNVRAAVGGQAAHAASQLGARAYATAGKVAFSSEPDLHTAAHEAAHVIQQRHGATADARYERHADDVAEAVVAGRSAEGLLDELVAGTASNAVVQLKEDINLQDLIKHLDNNPFDNIDGREIDWTARIQPAAPPATYKEIDCAIIGELYGAENQSEHSVHDGRSWNAIKQVTASTSSTRNAVASDVAAFKHAERDHDLRALLFLSPSATGDVASFADHQRPARGGPKVMDVFDEDNQMSFGDHDRKSIAKERQRGGFEQTDVTAGATIRSGSELRAALLDIRVKSTAIDTAGKNLEAVTHEQAFDVASNEADDARAEIEALKEEMSLAKDAVNAATTIAAAVAHIVQGEVGDAIDKVGVIAGIVLNHIEDWRITSAKQKLGKALRQMKTARGREIAAKISAGRSALLGAFLEFERSKELLRAVYTQRRNAYNLFGAAAGREHQGSSESKQQLSALMSAIPIVEIVVAKARSIVGKAVLPEYTERAGHGLWMANRYHDAKVPLFIAALGEIEGAREIYQLVFQKWNARLKQLTALEQQVLGARPGA